MSAPTTPEAAKSACIFCNIANKLTDTEILFEDEEVCVFRDIKPASKYHVLVIPKRHIEDAKALVPADKELGKTSFKISKVKFHSRVFVTYLSM